MCDACVCACVCGCGCTAYQEYDESSKKIRVMICAVKSLPTDTHARLNNRYDVDLFGSWNIHMHAFITHQHRIQSNARIQTHRQACKRTANVHLYSELNMFHETSALIRSVLSQRWEKIDIIRQNWHFLQNTIVSVLLLCLLFYAMCDWHVIRYLQIFITFALSHFNAFVNCMNKY